MWRNTYLPPSRYDLNTSVVPFVKTSTRIRVTVAASFVPPSSPRRSSIMDWRSLGIDAVFLQLIFSSRIVLVVTHGPGAVRKVGDQLHLPKHPSPPPAYLLSLWTTVLLNSIMVELLRCLLSASFLLVTMCQAWSIPTTSISRHTSPVITTVFDIFFCQHQSHSVRLWVAAQSCSRSVRIETRRDSWPSDLSHQSARRCFS